MAPSVAVLTHQCVQLDQAAIRSRSSSTPILKRAQKEASHPACSANIGISEESLSLNLALGKGAKEGEPCKKKIVLSVATKSKKKMFFTMKENYTVQSALWNTLKADMLLDTDHPPKEKYTARR